jgi:hypothetical protein
MGVVVDNVKRRETSEKAELLLDLRITRHVESPQPVEIPLRVVVNGTSTTTKVMLKDNQLALHSFAIPVDKVVKRGSGRVELPNDAYAPNNVYYFVFDEPPVLRSVIVSDEESDALPLKAALSAAVDPSQKYEATILPSKRAAEIPWDETALVVWNAPIPKPDDVLAKQLEEHASAGRTIIFLPPETPDDTAIFGLHWAAWETADGGKPQTVEWWRADSDLLANTRDGVALSVGSLEVIRRAKIVGDGVPLARMSGREPLLVRSTAEQRGAVYFLGTLPAPGASSLARDGVTMFAMFHRALNEGTRTLGKAQQRVASATALGSDPGKWHPLEDRADKTSAGNLPLRAGVVASGDQLCALNRPPGEDEPQVVSTAAVGDLFAGLDYRVLTDTVENGRSLTNEVWRTFLLAMAAALLVEAILCMPPRPEDSVSRPIRNSFRAGEREREHSLV